jgi:phosphatidylglycerol:prolipoprotein diacylglycerol transferase
MWADIAAPGVALAQAIGRWGNYVNQEVYGSPTTLPWAIKIDPQYRLEGYTQYSTFHPLFLYESIWNLMLMVFLLWMDRKHANKLMEGDIFLMYLIGYSTGRFFLEFLRLDAAVFGTINVNQTFMLAVAVVSGIIIFWRHRKYYSASTQTNTPKS